MSRPCPVKMLMISALPLWSLGSGRGAASFARTLQGLSERNVRIHLLSGTRLIGPLPEGVTCDVFEPRWLTRLFRVRGFTWCSRSAAWFLFHGWALLKGATHFRRTRPDCIYGYEIQGAPAASLLGRLFRCPSISRFQGTILFPHLASRRWRLYYWDHVLALRAPTDLVIMTNDGTQGNIVLRRLGVPDERVRFWMNGVDAPEHDPGRGTPSLSEDSLDGSDPDLTAFKDQGGRVLVTVSRLVSWKRVDRVIRAMPRILQSRPTTMLVVVGDGATRTEYEALAASLGVSHRVRFVGAVAQTEVPKYLRQADVFVSLFDLSNLGNPLLEAMSLGCCVLTLDNGDTGSVIQNQVTGVLLDPSLGEALPDAVAEAVLALLADDRHRHQLGTQAAAYARSFFWSWYERIEAEYTEIRSLLSRSTEAPTRRGSEAPASVPDKDPHH